MSVQDDIRTSLARLENVSEEAHELAGVIQSLQRPQGWLDDSDDLKAPLGAIAATAQSLQEEGDLVDFEDLNDRLEQLKQQLAAEREAADAALTGLKDRLEELGEEIPERLGEKFEEMVEFVTELRDRFVESTEAEWQDKATQTAAAWQDGFEEVLGSQQQKFAETAETVGKQLEKSLEELGQLAGEELKDALQEEAQEVMDAAMERLKQEVFDGVAASQIQVQLTAMMAPMLPSLIAVRVVAGTIKRLLDILRMGF